MRCFMEILVTGSTGYIGGRLVPQLLAKNHEVTVFVRDPGKLSGKPWRNDVNVIVGDGFNPSDVAKAVQGIDVVYFLLHALSTSKDFVDKERKLASIFGEKSREAQVKRIIYLGGLINKTDTELSHHLASREETGVILRSSGVPTIELRAAVILGSGSASFEMLRYLTERLPLMTTPKWVKSKIQPISIRDVLYYMVAVLDLPENINRSFDIGGPDVLSYDQMMQRYAKIASLKPRVIIPVPVLSPGLSSHWVGFITPVPPSVAKPLVESLKHDVVCLENDINSFIDPPASGLLGFEDSCKAALAKIKDRNITSHWSDASNDLTPSTFWPGDPEWSGGTLFKDVRVLKIHSSKYKVWETLMTIGGETGWFSPNFLWRIRGRVDRFVGGVGLKRGRRDPVNLHVGDAVDFWRVEEVNPFTVLRLKAEMKLPGVAWLEFSLQEVSPTETLLTQKAIYHPYGVSGILYWKSIAVFHRFVFPQMINNIKKITENS
jgi:uncharacterized protein YbjT (DUF2867 family)